MWVKKSHPLRFSDTFPKRLGIFNNFLTHVLCVPICARSQIFIHLSPTLTKLCHTKRDHPSFFYISLELNFWVCLLSKWRHCWPHVISSMFVDIIKAADLGWLATETTINKAINNFRKRLNVCVSADGGYFERIAWTRSIEENYLLHFADWQPLECHRW